MLKLTKTRNVLPIALLASAMTFPVPAYAADWGILTTIVDALASLFAPAKQSVPVLREPSQRPVQQYGNYDPGATGYPIAQSKGMYQYVGPNGETYTVDHTGTIPRNISANSPTLISPYPEGGVQVNDPQPTYTASQSSGNYPWPTAGGPISSTYGNRERVGRMCHKDDNGNGSPTQHCGVHSHNGLDLAVPSGTAVNSVTGGKVVWISPSCKGGKEDEAGCVVSVMNPDGELSTYMHLSGTKKGLKVGDEVAQGEQVAISGNSGTATTGAHLHFEMCKVPPGSADGKTSPRELCSKGERINPLSKLNKDDPRYNNACVMSQRNPLNANIKPPCAYKPKTKDKKKNKNKTKAPPPPEPVDTRQSTVVKGMYG